MRHPGSVVAAALLALTALGIPDAASARANETERIEKTVPMKSGGTLTLKNFSGSVKIVGEDRTDVAVVAVRTAPRDRLDRIRLEIEAHDGNVAIEANRRPDGDRQQKNNVVETAFDIRVPSTASLDVNVFSSPVEIRGVTGRHRVRGFSSTLRLDGVTGPVDLETFSGGVYLSPASWQPGQSVAVKTFSGDVEVRLPAAAGGHVAMESFSGEVTSELPLVMERKSRRLLEARLDPDGGGDGELTFKTFSGDVRLLK